MRRERYMFYQASHQLHMCLLWEERMSGGFQKVKPRWNLPGEVLLPQHVAGNRWVPGWGHLGRLVHWLGLHRPKIVVADMVVYHGGEGWREGQASRGKERMIKTHVHKKNTERLKMTCPILVCFFSNQCIYFPFNLGKALHCSFVIENVLNQRTKNLVKLSLLSYRWANLYINKQALIDTSVHIALASTLIFCIVCKWSYHMWAAAHNEVSVSNPGHVTKGYTVSAGFSLHYGTA